MLLNVPFAFLRVTIEVKFENHYKMVYDLAFLLE